MALQKPKKRFFKYIKSKLIVFYCDNIHSIFSNSLERTRMQVIAGIAEPFQDNADLYKRYDAAVKYIKLYKEKPVKKEDTNKEAFIKILTDAKHQGANIAATAKTAETKSLWELGEDAKDKLEKYRSEPTPEISAEEEMKLFQRFIESGKKAKQTK